MDYNSNYTYNANDKKFKYQVKLLNIDLKDFRNFDRLFVEFHEQITVIISPNGGGKTTILRAIVNVLKSIVKELFLKEQVLDFKISNIQYGKEAFIINADLGATYKDIFIDTGEESDSISSEVVNKIEATDDVVRVSVYSTNNGVENSIKNLEGFSVSFKDEKSIDESAEESNIFYERGKDWLPVFAFYSNEILDYRWSKDNHVIEDEFDSLFSDLYYDALEDDRFKYGSFFKWFETSYKVIYQQEFFNLKKDIKQRIPNIKYIKKAFDLVKSAILDFLNYEFILAEKDKKYTDLLIRFDFKNDKFLIEKEGVFMLLSQLSTGEKSLISLIGDLAIRMIRANPIASDLDEPLSGNGIVVIDELDMHLHPSKQLTITHALTSVFPNVQFVISTHSPFITQAVDESSRIVIKNGSIKKISLRSDNEKLDINSTLSSYYDINNQYDAIVEMKYNRFMELFIQIKYGQLESDNSEFRNLIGELININETMKNVIVGYLRNLEV